MKKMLVIVLVCYFLPGAVMSQDTLRGNYSNLHLTGRSYFVSEMVTVTDSFTVDAGARILLANGISIICRGPVSIKGLPDKRVRVESAASQSAQGFVFAAYAPGAIDISYTSFAKLVLPLNFEYGWYRTKAEIHDNEFINNVGSTAVVQVLNPASAIDNTGVPVAFTLSANLFAQNQAPVYFEDLAGDLMQVRIVANTFTANTIRDYGKYTFSSNFLFGRIDNPRSKYIAEVTQNSFAGNMLWDTNADSVLHAANMGVYGSMDSVKFPGNYWGQGDESAIRKSIYDYAVNYTSPKVVVTPLLEAPGENLPPHTYKAERLPIQETQRLGYRFRDGKWKIVIDSIGTAIKDNFDLRTGLQVLRLTLNRKVNTKGVKLHFVHLRDSLNLADTVLNCKIDTASGRNAIIFDFNFSADSLFRVKPGYIVVNGLEGVRGEFIADTKVGYAYFLHLLNERKLEYQLKKSTKKDSVDLPKPAVPAPIIVSFKKKYEIGFIGAYALYFGTLSNKALFKNDFNTLIGLQFRYSIKNHISLSLAYMSTTLTGSDLRSGDSSKIKRGMSFKTPVTNISFQVEYDFLDNSIYSTRNKLRPSIGFGVDYMSFTPMGEYLGKWYELQPMGTGGQRLAGSTTQPYLLTSLGAPITAQVRYYLNKKTIYTLFASYHLAFTDYLDDVGPDPYPDGVQLAAANGANGDAAAYFANPTRRVVGKSQLRSGLADGADSFFTFGFTLAYHF
jgi:hypothetical protein